MRPVTIALICALALAWTALTEAGQPCENCQRAQSHCRAGCPQTIGRLAIPSNTRNYLGYYVGGGSAGPHAEARATSEGTWGWDYGGILFPKRVALGWSHGRRYQGGTGAYRTAGPSPLPSQ